MFILEQTFVEITDTAASIKICKIINPKSKTLESINMFVVFNDALSIMCCEIFAKNIYASDATIFNAGQHG